MEAGFATASAIVCERTRMKKIIITKLRQLEKEHSVTILYACEAGSRAYGLQTNESDYDVRFIFKYETSEYLKLRRPAEVLTHHEGLVEYHGWDLYKAMELLNKSNPSLYEWLFSSEVYIENTSFAMTIRELIQNNYSLKSLGYHYLQLLRTNMKKRVKEPSYKHTKILLHIVRSYSYLHYMKTYKQLPLVAFSRGISMLTLNKEQQEAVDELQSCKKTGRPVRQSTYECLHERIHSQMENLQMIVEELPEGKRMRSDIDLLLLNQHKSM